MAKVKKRLTWREFSDEICRCNDFPPGFHFVLVDGDGRVKRSDSTVVLKDGNPYSYYRSMEEVSFMIWSLSNDAIVFDEDVYSMVLRDSKGGALYGDTTLRRIRDMDGLPDASFDGKRGDRDDAINDLSWNIAEALSGLREDETIEEYDDDFVLAMVRFLYSHYVTDAVEHAVSLFKKEWGSNMPFKEPLIS